MNNDYRAPTDPEDRPAVLAVVQRRRKPVRVHQGVFLTLWAIWIVGTYGTGIFTEWPWWRGVLFGLLLGIVVAMLGIAYGRIKDIHRALTGGDR